MPVTIRIQRKHKGILEKLIRSFKKEDPKVLIGFPAGEAKQGDIMKAVWNEFGTRGGRSGGGWGGPIPERPFMRNAVRKNMGAYRSAMEASALPILLGRTSAVIVLSKLGIKGQGDVQSEITSLTSPANSPTTVKLKGSSKPLIDTGAMRGAVTWKLER